ncbi:aldo/keto reductase [Fusobacterium sp.]|uniref:aldo/keto reductase n=1 Tax=Fusobacterium sp. TaxID=68766 RepID=UPI0026178383|nr:aldo/keto reductase [Fusobacterium sp.]
MKNIALYNGVLIPEIGFGTWKAPTGKVTVEAVKAAIECGYTHIDCAAIYGNEKEVGLGIKESNVDRKNLFITSKLWNDVRGYQETIDAFNQTLKDLQLDYLDLYLIHWPRPVKYHDNYIKKNIESWKAMEDLYKQGKIKAIGVSNFKVHHMEEIMENCEIKPMVNQLEFHPSCLEKEIRDFCKKENIVVTGYSPLANGKVFECKELVEFSEKYGVRIAQLCIRYALQHDVVPLVKSVTKERIKANLNINFVISDEDMKKIDKITTCGGSYKDSDNISF